MVLHHPTSHRRLQLGCVPYINALPFSIPLGSSVSFHPPIQLNHLLQQGSLDCALTSSVMGRNKTFCFLSSYGIAAHRHVLSVNLYVPTVPEEMQTIALDPSSATSVQLLKILYSFYWKQTPQFVSMKEPHQGYLLIGDAALRHIPPQGWSTIDLCSVWHEWTGLPFIFALFIYPSSLPQQSIELIELEIEAALSWSSVHTSAILIEAAKRIPLPFERLSKYYQELHYRLHQADWEGFSLFQKYLSALNL